MSPRKWVEATGAIGTLGGYLVSPEREDCRLAIESVRIPDSASDEDRARLAAFARDADEFDGLTAWWD